MPKKMRWRLVEQSYHVDSELVESFDSFSSVVPYMRMVLQSHLIQAATILNQVKLSERTQVSCAGNFGNVNLTPTLPVLCKISGHLHQLLPL